MKHFCTKVRMVQKCSTWCNENWQGRLKVLRKPAECHFVLHKSHMNWLWIEPCSCNEKLVTNSHYSYYWRIKPYSNVNCSLNKTCFSISGNTSHSLHVFQNHNDIVLGFQYFPGLWSWSPDPKGLQTMVWCEIIWTVFFLILTLYYKRSLKFGSTLSKVVKCSTKFNFS
jgi:hypothetical protein